MDTAAITVKFVGLILFLFTVRSVYKHFNGRTAKHPPAQGQSAPASNSKPERHSKVEQALNAFLLYAWFVFMTALSLGMIVNN
jgi:hypothetical protein